MEKNMKNRNISLVTAFLLSASQGATALNITFDYTFDTNGFFNSQERKNVLEAAGNYWGTRINDNLNAVISSEPRVRSYDVNIRHPSIGSLDDEFGDHDKLRNFSIAENEYKIFVGARELEGSTVGIAAFGGSGNIFGGQDYVNEVISRGQSGALLNPPTDFGSWGGWASFDNRSTTNWYFDDLTNNISIDDVPDGQSDFFSFALHEIGHVLAISSGGPTRGGENVDNLAGDTVRLDDSGHFTDGQNGFGGGLFPEQDALMDPIIDNGTRKLPTNLDYAILTDIGWEVTAVPVPATVWLFGTALLGLIGFKKRF